MNSKVKVLGENLHDSRDLSEFDEKKIKSKKDPKTYRFSTQTIERFNSICFCLKMKCDGALNCLMDVFEAYYSPKEVESSGAYADGLKDSEIGHMKALIELEKEIAALRTKVEEISASEKTNK